MSDGRDVPRFGLVDDHVPVVLLNDIAYRIVAAVPGIEDLPVEHRMIAAIETYAGGVWEFSELEVPGNSLSYDAIKAPLARPGKIVCCAGNYKEGLDAPSPPLEVFLKSPDSVLAPGGTIELPDAVADVFHHEAELVVVIGSRIWQAPRESAMKGVFGYTCGIDVSARGFGKLSIFTGKSFDTFGPLGPWIVPKAFVADPHDLDVRLTVDGVLRQDYSTSDMDHRIDEVISNVSHIMTLRTGDVIFCGTNHRGLGPLQDGDHVALTISGIGSLEVSVVDPLRRSWARQVDKEMAEYVVQMRADLATGS